MECHGLEMFGPIRSADDIDAIEFESVTGKVSIKEGLQFDVGAAATYTLAADTDGNASWQIKSAPANTVMLFLQASPPTGWSTNDAWQDGSMLVYQDWVEGLGIQNGGSDDPKDWTTAITVDSSDTSQHRHSMSDVTDPADLPKAGGNDDHNLSLNGHTHAYSGITNDNDANSEHSHGVGQDTWTPKYQEVILGTKD
jgi:hypothetical protein